MGLRSVLLCTADDPDRPERCSTVGYLPTRAASVTLPAPAGPIRPHYPFFAPFEYDFYRALSAEHGFTDA